MSSSSSLFHLTIYKVVQSVLKGKQYEYVFYQLSFVSSGGMNLAAHIDLRCSLGERGQG